MRLKDAAPGAGQHAAFLQPSGPPTSMSSAVHDFLTQTLAVSALVAGLLLLTRRGGTWLAGIATAALSAPTLLLLALHEGAAFARLAALGTLLSAPACALLAALAARWLARPAAGAGVPLPGQAWLSTLLAGAMSASVCALAHDLGALGSGFVGGLPMVAAWTMLGTRWHSGAAAARHYVQAYRRGLGPRCVMNLVFAAAALPLGAGWAMALALAASAIAACWWPPLHARLPRPA